MGDEFPAPVSCPHCGNGNAKRAQMRDRRDYRCPTCGAYSISETQQERFDKGSADPKAAGFLVDVGGRRWLIGLVG